MTTRETSEDIDDAAAVWAARLDGEPLSFEERRALEAWTTADPRRQGALARAMAILAHFDRAKALGPQFDPRAHARPSGGLRIGRREFVAGGSLAAGLGAVAVLAPSLLQPAQQFATAKGEVRSVPLEDGSVVWLNTGSTIKVNYNSSRRGIVLVSGEALFDVAKNPSRPFVVRAESMDVRAVGTSFTVSRLANRPVEVVVREGLVDLSRDDSTAVRLTPGARALAPSSGPVQVSQLGSDSVSRALSWRKGLLDFDGTTLGDAAATFARYSDQQIVIDDPELSGRTVTGLFSSTNPVGFAQAVALSMNIKARTVGDTVHLSH
ncbi:FecR domain-containing protein [Phenylobacterium sp.]|uniref:FecR family protein n=1 Tax=Phenylobacterium sp. TaxID=1871053 RepID=UPI00356545B6